MSKTIVDKGASPTFRVVARSDDGTDEHVIATGKTEKAANRVADGALINIRDDWHVVVEEET